jgi:3-oxoacyl-[acyl-carrier-protein] synthase III
MRNATRPPELAAVFRTERRNGHRIAPPRAASVLGLGHYLPAEVVANEPIAERIEVDDEWIVKRTGIRSRHRAAADESLTNLAARAGHNALLVPPDRSRSDGRIACC